LSFVKQKKSALPPILKVVYFDKSSSFEIWIDTVYLYSNLSDFEIPKSCIVPNDGDGCELQIIV
jgi:hypothetical protein